MHKKYEKVKHDSTKQWTISIEFLRCKFFEWTSNRSASPMWILAKLINWFKSWWWTSLFGFEWFTDANQTCYIFCTLEVQQNESLILFNVNGVGKFQMIDDFIMWIITARCFTSWCILIRNVIVQTVKVFLVKIIE